MTARDTRVLKKLTLQLVQTEERRYHLKRLVSKRIGFREEEEFLAKECSKLRGKKFNGKEMDKILSLVMKKKDNLKFERRVRRKRNNARREVMEDLGPRSIAKRAIMRGMRSLALEERVKQKQRFRKKEEFLTNKYGKETKREEELDKADQPVFKGARIFCKVDGGRGRYLSQ